MFIVRETQFIKICENIFETYIFPSLILYTAVHNIAILSMYGGDTFLSVIDAFTNKDLHIVSLCFLHITKRTIFIILNIMIFISFMIRQKATEGAKTIAEIFIPIIMIFFWFALNLSNIMPKYIVTSIAPPRHAFTLSIIGTILSITGWLIACIATYNLRHSFSITVNIRPLVTTGIYSRLRHPIYASYILIAASICCYSPSILVFTLFAGYYMITLCRIRLEERRLSQFYPKYVEYMNNTPAIWPKF